MNFHKPFHHFQRLSIVFAGRYHFPLKTQLEARSPNPTNVSLSSQSRPYRHSHVISRRLESNSKEQFQKNAQLIRLQSWRKDAFLANEQINGEWYHQRRYPNYMGLLLCGFGALSASCLTLLSEYFLEDGVVHSIWPSVHADRRNKNNFIADVAEKAAPAVVFLEIKGRHPLTGRHITVSNGSGFIVRESGIILTNAHVVANKSAISVKLEDGRMFEGQVTAVDPVSDLATVKIPANNLPSIPLGDSSQLRPGEWVIAMGSPLSLSNTVTCGIVSSVQRGSKELGLRNRDMGYIQTDAVINFGNSGGPLIDLEGKAIGINTMKVTTGISFAIPSDHAIKFLNKAEDLMKRGKGTVENHGGRRYMGITMLSLTDSIIRDLRKDRVSDFRDVHGGVYVYKVIPGSPAHTGGILAGDIIEDIDGKSVKSAADVYDAVDKMEKLVVTIVRGQARKRISINTKEAL